MRSAALLLLVAACAPARPPAAAAVVEVKPVAASAETLPEPDGSPGFRAGVLLPPMAAAERLFAEGRAYAERGEDAAALDRFETSYRIAPNDAALYGIGQTLERMGRRGEAAEVYEKYLQTDLSPMDRMSMELRIQQLRRGP
jgi:tetratricopeptide (TPR) repeat protein